MIADQIRPSSIWRAAVRALAGTTATAFTLRLSQWGVGWLPRIRPGDVITRLDKQAVNEAIR